MWIGLAAVPLCAGLGLLAIVSGRAKAVVARTEVPTEQKISCDEEAIITATEGYADIDPKHGLELAQKYIHECRDYPRLHWPMYTLHKRTHQLDEAIADATALIKDKPHDQDFWWWRGVIHERLGHYREAAADYRQSIANNPDLEDLPLNLAEVYQSQKRPCEALVALERYGEVLGAADGDLKRLMADNRLRGGGCKDFAGRGTTIFKPSEDGLVRAQAKLRAGEKTETATLVVEEETGYVVLTRPLAERLGLELTTAIQVNIGGVATDAKLATLDLIEAGATHASTVEVAVVDSLPVEHVDGLLGLSYLWRFRMKAHNGALSLRPR
jgi:tetratricopeptide (TPR) repeat protein